MRSPHIIAETLPAMEAIMSTRIQLVGGEPQPAILNMVAVRHRLVVLAMGLEIRSPNKSSHQTN